MQSMPLHLQAQRKMSSLETLLLLSCKRHCPHVERAGMYADMNLSTAMAMRSRQARGKLSRRAAMILMSGLSLLDQPSSTMVVTAMVDTTPLRST